MPQYDSAARWMDALKEREQFGEQESYTPVRGDLVFLDISGEGGADHMGIVQQIYQGEDDAWMLDVIEGDSSNCIQTATYRCDGEEVLGYGILHTPVILEENAVPRPKQLQRNREEAAFT